MACVGLQLGEYLGVLKEQNKTLQKRYDNLLLLATAPVKNELEVPDDLNFLGNTADEASEVQRQNYRLCAVSCTGMHHKYLCCTCLLSGDCTCYTIVFSDQALVGRTRLHIFFTK